MTTTSSCHSLYDCRPDSSQQQTEVTDSSDSGSRHDSPQSTYTWAQLRVALLKSRTYISKMYSNCFTVPYIRVEMLNCSTVDVNACDETNFASTKHTLFKKAFKLKGGANYF